MHYDTPPRSLEPTLKIVNPNPGPIARWFRSLAARRTWTVAGHEPAMAPLRKVLDIHPGLVVGYLLSNSSNGWGAFKAMSQENELQTRIRVAALIARGDEILLAEHEKGGRRYWLLPGGGMEYGESIEETLKRELLEEAGLEIEVGDLLWMVESIPEDRHRHVLNLILRAQARSEVLHPTPDRVLRDVRWMKIRELETLRLFPDTLREILDYLETGESGPILLGRRWK